MANKTIQIYPSPEYGQKEGDNVVKLQWAIAYLEQIMRGIPPGSVKSARFRGWGDVVIDYEKPLSAIEEKDVALDTIIAPLEVKVAANENLSKAELAALVTALKGV